MGYAEDFGRVDEFFLLGVGLLFLLELLERGRVFGGEEVGMHLDVDGWRVSSLFLVFVRGSLFGVLWDWKERGYDAMQMRCGNGDGDVGGFTS